MRSTTIATLVAAIAAGGVSTLVLHLGDNVPAAAQAREAPKRATVDAAALQAEVERLKQIVPERVADGDHAFCSR
jgi:hypothetical protein